MEQLISTLKQNRFLQLFTISLRYVLGASFVYASVFKIQGRRFMPAPSASTAADSLAHLFEAMYQAGTYWHFIGWGQLIAGFLLMSQVFSTLGAVAFFTIVLNIFVITLSFESASIQAITFLMLLGTIYLLLWDWNKLKFIALPKPQNYLDNTAEFSTRRVWTYLGLFYFLGVVLLRNAMIGNLLSTKFIPTNFVLLGAVLMLLIGGVTVVTQLAKKMKGEQIQTLHPIPGKTNKRIALEKYEVIKEQILSILSQSELTHTELMEQLYTNVKDTFVGGVQWYGETVKLDLEARKVIERTRSKPEKYRLVNKSVETDLETP